MDNITIISNPKKIFFILHNTNFDSYHHTIYDLTQTFDLNKGLKIKKFFKSVDILPNIDNYKFISEPDKEISKYNYKLDDKISLCHYAVKEKNIDYCRTEFWPLTHRKRNFKTKSVHYEILRKEVPYVKYKSYKYLYYSEKIKKYNNKFKATKELPVEDSIEKFQNEDSEEEIEELPEDFIESSDEELMTKILTKAIKNNLLFLKEEDEDDDLITDPFILIITDDNKQFKFEVDYVNIDPLHGKCPDEGFYDTFVTFYTYDYNNLKYEGIIFAGPQYCTGSSIGYDEADEYSIIIPDLEIKNNFRIFF